MSIRIGDRIISGGGGGGNGESLTNQNLSSDITQVYNWVGTYADYVEQDVANTHPDWVCYITDDEFGDEQEYEIVQYTGHNVGDIFFTSRKDGWLNGAVECNGEVYTTTDYIGEESIGELLKKNLVPYVSMSEYETLLTNNGSVGVFGWNGGDNNQFRVPTLNDLFLETGKATELGEFVQAGLPNITGDVTFYGVEAWNGGGSGALKVNVSDNSSISHHSGGNERIPKLNFDASRSSELYGSSDTVQPKAVKYRPMVQLSTGFNDEAIDTCRSLKEFVYGTVTNCVTKVPQDIKLKWVDGDLYILKGSKVYIPNGYNNDNSLRFDTIIIPADLKLRVGAVGHTGIKHFVYVYEDGSGSIGIREQTYSNSWVSPGIDPTGYDVRYNYDENIIKYTEDNGATWSSHRLSFPVCQVINTGGKVVGITQVFNGVGYIDSAMYMLPGIEALAPAGRDENGNAINYKITTQNVFVRDSINSNSSTRSYYQDNIILQHEGKTCGFWKAIDCQVDRFREPATETGYHVYSSDTNQQYYSSNGAHYIQASPESIIGYVSRADDGTSRITGIHLNKQINYKNQNLDNHRIVDYREPNDANSYTWYRLYADGWVEQGQRIKNLSTREFVGRMTLPIKMLDANYTIFLEANSNRGDNTDWNFSSGATPKSATQFSYSVYGIGTSDIITGVSWYVCGQSAYYE